MLIFSTKFIQIKIDYDPGPAIWKLKYEERIIWLRKSFDPLLWSNLCYYNQETWYRMFMSCHSQSWSCQVILGGSVCLWISGIFRTVLWCFLATEIEYDTNRRVHIIVTYDFDHFYNFWSSGFECRPSWKSSS